MATKCETCSLSDAHKAAPTSARAGHWEGGLNVADSRRRRMQVGLRAQPQRAQQVRHVRRVRRRRRRTGECRMGRRHGNGGKGTGGEGAVEICGRERASRLRSLAALKKKSSHRQTRTRFSTFWSDASARAFLRTGTDRARSVPFPLHAQRWQGMASQSCLDTCNHWHLSPLAVRRPRARGRALRALLTPHAPFRTHPVRTIIYPLNSHPNGLSSEVHLLPSPSSAVFPPLLR
eukprot:6203404-Pleurochrysis_carterae.AAC.1